MAAELELEGASARADPRRRLARFVLLTELGKGGMGIVYRAWDDRMRRVVAIKTLLPGALADPDAPGRFRREAQALARLRHPNVVAVHEVGDAGTFPYLV